VNSRVVTARRATIGTTPLNAKSLVSMQKTFNAVGKVHQNYFRYNAAQCEVIGFDAEDLQCGG
jgi:hypothetical protein